MKHLDKYDGITGQELPRRAKRILKPVYLSMSDFIRMYKAGEIVHDGPNAWGSVQNNSCDLYRHKDGRWIECYQVMAGSMETYFIESV